LASLVVASQSLDLAGHLIDARVEVMQVPGETLDHVHHSRGADDSDGDVSDESITRPPDDLPGQPSRNEAHEQNIEVLVLTFVPPFSEVSFNAPRRFARSEIRPLSTIGEYVAQQP
jgi:hypothetical protein